MANPEHLRILKQGVEAWNQWRADDPMLVADLTDADLAGACDNDGAYLRKANLRGTDLRGANLRGANLKEANLSGADLCGANLSCANLIGAYFIGSYLSGANLGCADFSEADFLYAKVRGADLRKARLNDAHLIEADFRGADLRDADLSGAVLVRTNLKKGNLTGCRVYGVSAWDVDLTDAVQKNIIITPEDQPTIQVDRLDIAQFIYLLLNNAEIRHVIDTITSKVVLILGRFTEERKAVLEALRAELRTRDYLPILFDWDKPSSRTTTETVSILAHMAKFVIADITDAKSIPQELSVIVPSLPSVPVQPLLLSSQREYGMFEHFLGFRSVLPIEFYESQEELLASLHQKIIEPAEAKLRELKTLKASSATDNR